MYGIGSDVAGPGDIVAFSTDDYAESGDHGTLCASGIAAQCVIDGGSPDLSDELHLLPPAERRELGQDPGSDAVDHTR